MQISLNCPKCKQELQYDPTAYYCENCKLSFKIKDGYVDFINHDFYAGEVSRVELRTMLTDIDNKGYEIALESFFVEHPGLRDYIFDGSRADWQCHCVGDKFSRCLDIGSGLGNISENLSNNITEVYSLEAVTERLEFQKRRFKHSNKKNIRLIRANAVELPFPDNFFDLVICNGVLEWVASLNQNIEPRDAQVLFLSEVKRVLSSKGCLYVGIENRYGFPFILGAVDHSGIRYTSLMPRRVASFIVRRYGKAGGIYGDEINQKETRGYITYTYSLSEYKRLFNEVGFKMKSFWVIPSYNKPSFSGRTEDTNSLKGYMKYYMNTNNKFRIPFSVLSHLNKSLINRIGRFLAPSFLFFCYKDEIPETFDDSVVSQTALPSFVRITTGNGVMYISYDKDGKASKIVHLKRPKYGPRYAIQKRDKTKPELVDFEDDVWIENWLDGRRLDPLSLSESGLALKWLFDYQLHNRSEIFSTEEIKSQVIQLRTDLLSIPEMRIEKYRDFIDSYETYLCKISVQKAPEHGDFFYSNIIINDSSSRINVIDWEYYRQYGDPFFDLGFYVLASMELPTRSAKDFRNNFTGSGKFVKVLKRLKPLIDKHYGIDIDMNILLPYTLLRFIVRKYIERGKFDPIVIHFKNLLDILVSEDLRLNI